MTDLHDLLTLRAATIDAAPDALVKVLGNVRRRRRRRRIATTGGVLVLSMALVTGILDVREAPVPGQAAGLFRGPLAALQLRRDLGIVGHTKGASDVVVVRTRTARGTVVLSLVRVDSGSKTSLPVKARSASVSPGGDVVAAVTDHDVVVVHPDSSARTQRVATSAGVRRPSLSWGGNGATLFARVDDRWVRVFHPGQGSEERTVTLRVPEVPGGPSLLSISPTGDMALLFGVSSGPNGTPVPRLFLGRFDGLSVSDPQDVPIPPGALSGPMGWVGDNAFLLAPGSGEALIVRTDGSRVEVRATGIQDACRLAGRTPQCAPQGPDLLGTNRDGSLLFWRVAATAHARDDASFRPILILYYRTWLDGTHALRLTGPAGRYGPPVAAR